MSDSPFLVVSHLVKHYADDRVGYTALRDVSFSIQAGEFVAVRGPSGCGKSTLLHVLGAMDRPTTGEVLLAGRRLDRLSDVELAVVRRRQVGFVFQAFNLLPTLTAVENVALPLTLDGIAVAAANERAGEALGEVGLAARRDHYPSQLSGGEMQRVAIARAVAIRPDLVIADEPTGSLDSGNGTRVLELLSDLNRTRGLTIVMATHSADAAAFAERTLQLADGCLVESNETQPLDAPV